MASRPLPVVRRGGRVLGARGDGADALRDHRGRGGRLGDRQAPRDPRASTSPTPRSERGSSRGSRTCSASRRASPATRRTCSPPGASCSSASPSVDPVVLVFEDMQWADAGLLDFLDYLLDWSRNHPIFVLSLARPELAEKHPSWGAGKRAVTSLYLEPLPRPAMETLLAGLVPGLPGGAAQRRSSTARRAFRSTPSRPCGCCSTAVSSAHDGTRLPSDRADRDPGGARNVARARRRAARRARRRGTAPRPGRVGARQDVHEAGDRRAHRPRRRASSTRCSPRSLRKEVLSIQADPRSPERGQYSFLQDIVKHVAYETLSKRERKDKHLAAARYLATVWGGARRTRSSRSSPRTTSTPGALRPRPTDADEIKGTAREMLVRAAERASSLGATAEAQRAFERAIELAEDAAVAGRPARACRNRGVGRRARRRGDPPLRGCDRRLRERRRRTFGRAGVGPACRDHVGAREARGRGREPGALVRGALARTSRTRRSRRLRRSSGGSVSSPATSTERWSGPRSRSIWPRRCSCPRSSRRP